MTSEDEPITIETILEKIKEDFFSTCNRQEYGFTALADVGDGMKPIVASKTSVDEDETISVSLEKLQPKIHAFPARISFANGSLHNFSRDPDQVSYFATNVSEKLRQSFARATERSFINGTGNQEPQGILYNITEDNSVPSAYCGSGSDETQSPSFDDLLSLGRILNSYNVLPQNACWIMSPFTFSRISTDNELCQRLRLQGYQERQLGILGHPVYLLESMPDYKAESCCVAFGDFSRAYAVREHDLRTRIHEYGLNTHLEAVLLATGAVCDPDAYAVLRTTEDQAA